jgi:Protein of unknown function (DUF4231)
MLRRFPKLRAPADSWSVIPSEKRAEYPEFAGDFAVLDREVAPAFTEYDLAALRDQNSFRRQQVLILIGSALVTGLGGLQAVFVGQRWPGVVLAVIGVLLAASTRAAGEQSLQRDYLEARVKAERLRGLHFLYLSRSGPYAGPDREAALRLSVLAIRAGRDPE